MKNFKRCRSKFGMTIAVLIVGLALTSVFASCKGEVVTEYVTKEVEKTYASAVTFTVSETNTEGVLSLTMQSATEGAVIYYTADGSTPTTDSSKYTATLTVNADAVYKAVAVKDGMENSPVSTASVSIKEKKVTVEVDKKADEAAPAPVTNFAATAKDSRVLLTWTDAADSDIYGYEVSYSGTNAINRVVLSALDTTSMMVPQGAGGTYVSGLTNGTEYTFTVKSVDTSGNKSEGVTVKATPVAPSAGETLKIVLTADVPHENGYSGNKSNTKVTVTANITTASTVKKVVWKKDGSLIARTLLADTDATAATVGSDNKKWTFDINATDETANGTYTVAAIDEAGREETEQITIDNFDFTPPAKVRITYDNYDKNKSEILMTWTEPKALDYHHVKIIITSNDGIADSEPSEPITLLKGSTNNIFTQIDGEKAYYTCTFTTYDEVGNAGEALPYKVSVKTTVKNLPNGFVEVLGATVSGAISESKVFIEDRTLTIPDMYVCEHEVTQKEYETYCIYGGDDSPSDSYGKGDNYPVYYVSWCDAIIYCNLRSIEEELTPVYSFYNETDPRKGQWLNYITTGDEDSKYCSKSIVGGNIVEMIEFDSTANGYRLPTEAEWEYIARGGDNGIPTEQTAYAGSNKIDDVAWYNYNSENKVHEVKLKQKNTLDVYDMTGNVYEWCYDIEGTIKATTGPLGVSEGYNRVYRGGSYRGGGYDLNNSSYLPVYGTSSRVIDIGFRVVRNVH